MALVRINEEQAWLCNARIFDDLLHELEEVLAFEDPGLARVVAAVQNSQLHWWSIASLATDEFQIVRRAVENVRQKRGDQGPRNLAELDAYAVFMDRLDAFARLLQADIRAGSIRSQT